MNHSRFWLHQPIPSLTFMFCEVPPVDLIAGQMRAANADTDLELLVLCSTSNSAPFVERGLKRPSLFLWEVDGVLVAFVGYATPVNLGMEALVSALSHQVKQTFPVSPRVCLNADANNPAAKKAYENVGFVMHNRFCVCGLDAVEDSKIIPWSHCSSQRLRGSSIVMHWRIGSFLSPSVLRVS
ncbi:hypothetical protein AeRB84_000985 [Aphanomyces euteiches]|nr:hypothetical protein AeRB84_000985 [Aphanomyces euteiches]